MRSGFKSAIRALAIVAAVAALSGCYYPAPGYYGAYDGGYYAPAPYVYGSPVVGGVVIDGGGGRGGGRFR